VRADPAVIASYLGTDGAPAGRPRPRVPVGHAVDAYDTDEPYEPDEDQTAPTEPVRERTPQARPPRERPLRARPLRAR